METLDHLRKIARQSFYNTSHFPEKRGDQVIADYSKELDEDIAHITNLATTDESKAKLEETLSRYKQKYESLLSAWLHSHSNVASSFITGPANFPTERNRKRGEWADNKYNEFREWRKKALKAIERDLKEPVDELAMNRKKLENEKALHHIMVEANKIIRKNIPEVEKTDKLKELGLSDADVRKLFMPDYMGRIGYPSFALTNSSARIKQYEKRVAELESKEQAKGKEDEQIAFDDGEVILNYQLDRIQIVYAEKPSADTIAKLKSKGFKWSPSNRAWQRHLNNAGKYAVTEMTGVKFNAGAETTAQSKEDKIKQLVERGEKLKEPYFEKFLKRKGLTVEEYREMWDREKRQSIDVQWANSEEFYAWASALSEEEAKENKREGGIISKLNEKVTFTELFTK